MRLGFPFPGNLHQEGIVAARVPVQSVERELHGAVVEGLHKGETAGDGGVESWAGKCPADDGLHYSSVENVSRGREVG